MQFIRDIRNSKDSLARPCVATIGNFDGIHLGHQAILQQLKDTAAKLQLPSVVILFEPQPREYFSPQQAPVRLMTLREKLATLKQWKIDKVICLRFNAAFSKISAEKFIQCILVEDLCVQHLIVGSDFHFGHDRLGDFHLLQLAGKQYGFRVACSPEIMLHGERVSSTLVRAHLLAGELEQVKQCLGKDYTLSGRVIHGQKRGRELGFPTMNIPVKHRALKGVFVVEVAGLGDRSLPGVANVGIRPTVGGSDWILEVHLLNYQQSHYGNRISVAFLHKIRDEVRFESLEALKDQINRDVDTAQRYFAEKVNHD